ncbi:helix-turn-helix domain-containing protein [Bdellovibrio sp. BCCA]|uniref:helix-turn-helix domain-containing protein n=2 Tax=unclassified Bdellovibrio TaxID=2633795 RepID=UPI0030F32F3A
MASIETKYDKLMKRIAENIKKIRKSKGLSQRNMEDYGFDLRNYQRLEAGSHSPSLYTLHKLSIAFRVEISEFLK